MIATIKEAQEKIKIGAKYRHYKGGIYTVDHLAHDAGTERVMVVYHSENNVYYVRSVDMWLEPVETPRFKEISEV